MDYNELKQLIELAEDGYKLHKQNASHEEFLTEDKDIIRKAKEFLNKIKEEKEIEPEVILQVEQPVRNIDKNSYLYPAYIPYDLDDAIEMLNFLWNEEIKEKYKNMGEDKGVAALHHTTGRALRNKWNLWAEEPKNIAKYFHSIGITHADDMSGIILTSFHRQISGKAKNLPEQIKYYQDYWAKQKDDNNE